MEERERGESVAEFSIGRAAGRSAQYSSENREIEEYTSVIIREITLN